MAGLCYSSNASCSASGGRFHPGSCGVNDCGCCVTSSAAPSPVPTASPAPTREIQKQCDLLYRGLTSAPTLRPRRARRRTALAFAVGPRSRRHRYQPQARPPGRPRRPPRSVSRARVRTHGDPTPAPSETPSQVPPPFPSSEPSPSPSQGPTIVPTPLPSTAAPSSETLPPTSTMLPTAASFRDRARLRRPVPRRQRRRRVRPARAPRSLSITLNGIACVDWGADEEAVLIAALAAVLSDFDCDENSFDATTCTKPDAGGCKAQASATQPASTARSRKR